MDFNQLITVEYWNGLTRVYLTEIIIVLTAALVVVSDRYIRKTVAKMTNSFNMVSRFLAFLLFCSLGYTVLALGISWLLRAGFSFKGGIYSAPFVMLLLFIVAIEAQRQRQI